MEKRSTWSRVKETIGWTSLLSALGGLVALLGSTQVKYPTELRDYSGNVPVVFEMVFQKDRIREENTRRLAENTVKVWDERKKARLDSVAKVQAHNDSIKVAMAKKHMKPRVQKTQSKRMQVLKH